MAWPFGKAVTPPSATEQLLDAIEHERSCASRARKKAAEHLVEAAKELKASYEADGRLREHIKELRDRMRQE